MRHALAIDGKVGAAVDDPIEIAALPGRKARVEIGGHDFGRQHRDRVRPQVRVERIAHRIRIKFAGEIDMRAPYRAHAPASVRPAPCTCE